MDNLIYFKDYSFNPKLGELICRNDSGKEIITRLSPQPAKLLLLLISKYPDIVSHEEIKVAIWPEVHVDFNSSLHYCIRQIRSSLNEDSQHPQFIQTIPRRGYRWIAPIESKERIIQQNGSDRTTVDLFQKHELSSSPQSRRRKSSSVFSPAQVVGLIGLIAITFIIYSISTWKSTNSLSLNVDDQPTRVAIMPFQPLSASNDFIGNDIAYKLVESLANNLSSAYDIIGPTTTTRYAPDEMPNLIQDLELEYVLNGRFSQVKDTSRLLAEIIRASDGAHVWVKYFESNTDYHQISKMIVAGFNEHLLKN